MTDWQQFELECVDYLNQKYGNYFEHLGFSDSTTSDIKYKNGDREFFIEAKMSQAQSGQFVLLPDLENEEFVFSPRNKNKIDKNAEFIIELMNDDFERYQNAGTRGESLDLPQELASDWIINSYKRLGVEFVITKGDDFVIFPVENYNKYFDISCKYRVKKSGSSSVPKSRQKEVMEALKGMDFEFDEMDDFMIKSSTNLDKLKFSVNDTDYMIRAFDKDVYRIRKLSNTYNANVIFSTSLKNKQEEKDLLEFERSLGEQEKKQLKVVDSQLIKEFEKLPLDYWDFKNKDTKEIIHGIHTYPAVMVYPISREIINIVKKHQDIETMLDPFMGSGTSLVEGMVAGFSKVYGTDLNPLARLISKVKTKVLNCEELEEQVDALQDKIESSYLEFELILETIYEYLEEKNIDISEKSTVKDSWGSDAPNILMSFIKEHNKELDIPDFKNIGYWFVPNAIIELQIIKDNILKIDNPDIRDFVKVAFSETARLVSNRRNGEFKMYRRPVEKVKEFRPDVKSEFFSILSNNVKKMKEFETRCSNKITDVYILDNDARELHDVPDDSIDIVITSPPYGDSRTTVAYGEFSRVSLQWMDLDDIDQADITGIDKSLMGGDKYRKGFDYNLNSKTLERSLTKILEDPKNTERAGDVYSFYEDLEKSIEAITRKCKENSYQFWVVGNRTVKNENLKTSEIIIEMAEHYGLKHIHTIARNIPNKVMPSLNSPTNEIGKKVSTITNEHILVLRKKQQDYT